MPDYRGSTNRVRAGAEPGNTPPLVTTLTKAGGSLFASAESVIITACDMHRNNLNDTMITQLVVRTAVAVDIPAITEIYRHHVLHGLASFEIDPPDALEMARRHAAVIELALPYLVAELDDEIAGYAYAGIYRARAAYRYTVEDSVYVHGGHAGKGIGSILLPELISGCEKAGRRQMIAVIGDSENRASIRLHEKFGFQRVGLLPAVGFKFGRWVDSVLMQRTLGSGSTNSPQSAVDASRAATQRR